MAEWRCISSLAQSCSRIPECRGPKGVEYPGGLLAFSLTLGKCAGRFTQRAQVEWLKEHWKWILRYWYKFSKRRIKTRSTPSQSTICNYLAAENSGIISQLFTAEERSTMLKEWQEYSQVQKKRVKKRSAKNQSKKKRIPQYCLDGKARRGCTSKATGRTEIDLSLYCPETHQTLALRTLNDKEGEQKAAKQILNEEAKELPRGVFTGDAGIISPDLTKLAVIRNSSYILAIKGNAGHAYDDIISYNWNKVTKSLTVKDKPAHGREETRTIKAVKISEIGGNNLSKYHSASKVYEVNSEVHHKKENRWACNKRYFIGDKKISRWNLATILTYIRGHWGIETFHFNKDVSLKEDDCRLKANNGSRVLALFRAKVIKIASKFFDSLQDFIDKFSAKPRKMAKLIDSI